MMTHQPYDTARRRVDQLLGLGTHVFVFVAINAAIFAQTGFEPESGRFWGWGIGVAAHALVVLSPGSRFRQRMIARQLERQPRRNADGRTVEIRRRRQDAGGVGHVRGGGRTTEPGEIMRRDAP